MKKLVLRDRQGAANHIFVEDSQLPMIQKGMTHPIGFWCRVVGQKDPEWIAKGEVVRITIAGHEAPWNHSIDGKRLLDSPKRPELTAEQREENLRRLDSLKAQWAVTIEEKHAKEDKAREKAKRVQKAKEDAGRKKAKEQGEQLLKEENNGN